MFSKITLDYKQNLFTKLINETEFETITNGREGAVLISPVGDKIPIVRTTTKYTKPAQKFKAIHYDIVNKIRNISGINSIEFNNGLIEVYDNKYCTMGFHSDQSLDLEEDSYIAVYSCYENPQDIDGSNSRKLIVKNKISDEISEILMDHNSVILFDSTTNQKHLHKIVLENNNKSNRWLGITFRLSKAFVEHINGIPYLCHSHTILTLADKEESNNFYKLRSEENKSSEFKYPEINYTISMSDLMPIIL
jgi:hypothetical protein